MTEAEEYTAFRAGFLAFRQVLLFKPPPTAVTERCIRNLFELREDIELRYPEK